MGKTWRQLRMDLERVLTKSPEDIARGDGLLRRIGAFFTPGLLSVCIYRWSHFLWARGWRRTARLGADVNAWLFKAAIDPESCVSGGWFLPHPAGVSFHASAGRGLTVYSLSSCGPREPLGGLDDAPRFGDDVIVAVHAAVRGPVSIGDRAKIGFRTTVRDDVSGDQVVVARSQPGPEPRGCRETATATVPAGDAPQRLRDVRACLREDRRRLRQLQHGTRRASRMAYLSVWLHRLSRYHHVNGGRWSARLFWQLNLHLTGADIDPATQVSEGLVIPHPAGVSLHAVAGRDLTVMAMACVGPGPCGSVPRLADQVTLEPQALVYGPISVGPGVRVPAGSAVTSDVDAGTDLVEPTTLRLRPGSSRRFEPAAANDATGTPPGDPPS